MTRVPLDSRKRPPILGPASQARAGKRILYGRQARGAFADVTTGPRRLLSAERRAVIERVASFIETHNAKCLETMTKAERAALVRQYGPLSPATVERLKTYDAKTKKKGPVRRRVKR